jgi:hypothetical protein
MSKCKLNRDFLAWHPHQFHPKSATVRDVHRLVVERSAAGAVHDNNFPNQLAIFSEKSSFGPPNNLHILFSNLHMYCT